MFFRRRHVSNCDVETTTVTVIGHVRLERSPYCCGVVVYQKIASLLARGPKNGGQTVFEYEL